MKITVENVTKELKEDDDAYDDDESYILGYFPNELKGSHQVIRHTYKFVCQLQLANQKGISKHSWHNSLILLIYMLVQMLHDIF